MEITLLHNRTINVSKILKGLVVLFIFIPMGFAHDHGTRQEHKHVPEGMHRVRIKPTMVHMESGARQQFYVVKEQQRLTSARIVEKVVWSVNGVIGGNKTVGTITTNGLYQAPKRAPDSPEIHIGAEVEVASIRYLWATVLFDGKRPEYKTIMEWGESNESLNHFNEPKSIALDKENNILIAEGVIKRFSTNGKFLGEFGKQRGDIEDSFVDPQCVGVNKDGHIFVSDLRTGPPRIQKFKADGTYLYGFGVKGTGKGRVMDTKGIAFDSKQRIYIGDIDNMRISVFENSGEFVQIIGKKGVFPGEFNLPYGLATDANDDLFVVSYFGPCQKLTSDGHYLLSFAYADPPDGPVHFLDAASDRWGNIYLIVRGASNPDGSLQPVIDSEGEKVAIIKYNNYGEFVTSICLSVDDHEATRLVVDDSDKIFVLFKSTKKIGVEVLEQIH